MKKTLLFIITILFFHNAFSQEQKDSVHKPNIAIKWAPTGLILGSISLHGEYGFGAKSLTAKIGLPSNTRHTFQYENEDAIFHLKATSFLAGYRMYINKKELQGLYFEPFFKFVNHSAEGTGYSILDNQRVKLNFTNNYNGFGAGAQLGAQFLINKKFVIDLFFLGPELNFASNKFKAIEESNTLAWTSTQGYQAEDDIKKFISKFPFLRRNTDVMIDRENRTITAEFKGVVPGYRIGVSFGFAF
ncbi:MAG: hypothetical protein ACR2KB_07030 [Chitinophagaceae bacterium]|jgi:hypothetical protein